MNKESKLRALYDYYRQHGKAEKARRIYKKLYRKMGVVL